MRRGRISAFSMVEVALALGVVAFALVSVMALLPLGVKTNQISAEETRAANILTTVETDLRNSFTTSGKSLIYGLTTPYKAATSSSTTLSFNSGVSVLSTNTDLVTAWTTGLDENEEIATISTSSRPRYQATVLYTSVPASGTLLAMRARVIVNWPAVPNARVVDLTDLTKVNGFVEAYVTFPAP